MNLAVIAVISALSSAVLCDTGVCPTWMHPLSNHSSDCVCGDDVNHIVKCDNATREVYVLDCYLISYDDQLSEAIVGSSILGCNQYVKGKIDLLYHKVSGHVQLIESLTCSPLNRRGRFCGACNHTYYPLAYSYKLDCVPCQGSEHRRNLFTYLCRAFIPLTLFYLFVVLFEFNVHHPSVHACILFCQLLSSPVFVRAAYREIQQTRMVVALDVIWNLDFFRAVYPDLCLRLSPVQVLFLDYAVALYPLLLIVLTYVLVTLHSKGNPVIKLLCVPFQWTCMRCRKTWNIKSSLIDVFTTFLFLSYNKILSVSFDLLVYVHPYNSHGHLIAERFLFYDATINYFGREHKPYAIAAVVITFFFILLPFLLVFLYPFACFQKCLNCFNLSHIALHSFVDSVAGYYKDGTEPNSRDHRSFAAVFLFLPVLLYLSYSYILNSFYFVVGGVIFAGASLMLILWQPYREAYKQYRNVTQVFFLLMMLLNFTTVGVSFAFLKMYQLQKYILCLVSFIFVFPTFYLTALALRWLQRRIKCAIIHSRFQRLNFRDRELNGSSLMTACEARGSH